MQSKPSNTLKLLQWNAQGATTESVIAQIDHLLNLHNIDMAFLSETFASPNHDIRFTNYVVYRNDRSTFGGGVLIAVRNNIAHKRIRNSDTKVAENISIQVTVDKSPVTFTSAYVPKYTKSFKHDIDKLTPTNKNFVVVGDFNAKHTAWNCTSNNRAGKTLFNMLHTSNFVMHHPDSHTHFPHCGTTPSTIDFALTNGQFIFSHVYTLEGQMPSDHDPVVFHVECTPSQEMADAKPNYKKADWIRYQAVFDNHLTHTDAPVTNIAEIDGLIMKMVNLIRLAEAEAVPMERAKNPRKSKISPETINLIRLRNDTRRMWQRCVDVNLKSHYKSLVNAQNREIKNLIRRDFNKKWNDTLKTIKPGDNRLWTLTKKMMSTNRNRIEILTDGDQLSTSDQQIAETLADQFVKNHSLTVNYQHPIDNRVAKVAHIINNILPSTLDNSPHHVSSSDVRRVISKLKVKKAPGFDKIPNILLKRMPDSAIEMLTKIVNGCIDLTYFPAHFKIANVTPILKLGKSPKCAANYRPISLLSGLGKVFERLLHTKLSFVLAEKSTINAKQFGFREGHSTVHQIKRLVNIINDNKIKRKSTGMVLLDIEKAFDSVWHDGLIFKLHKIGIPLFLIKLISSFLTDRSFSVCVNGKQSTQRHIPAGLPQGSVLSPLLYAVFTSDLKIPRNCDAGFYADDTAITSAAKSSNTVIRHLATALKQIDNYFKKWRIKVNNEKTQAILFKFNQSKKRTPTQQLVFNGSIIQLRTEVKYLGVTIDHKLNFGAHTDTCRTKAINCFKSMYPLLCRKSRLSTRNKLTLYKAIIRPKMTYGSPVWSVAAASNISKLQLTQNKILKCIHGLPRRFPTVKLHSLSSIDDITKTISDQTKDFMIRCSMSPFELIRLLAS